MQLQSVLLSLFLATAVVAKGNGNKTLSTADECQQMKKLNGLVELAANTTKLDKVTKGNATKAAEIQAKASAASTELSTLQSNTTLVSACAVINAAQDEEDQCQETFILQKFVAFAANSTAVSAVTKDNATKAAEIQTKASAASTKLAELTSNSTLQAACPAVAQKDECKMMSGLQKFVDVANNQTKLDKLTKGNTTKEDSIKAKAEVAQTKLTALMSNSTLVSACQALETSQDGTTTSQAAASSSSAAVKKSAAVMVKGASAVGAVFSTMIVVAIGMFML